MTAAKDDGSWVWDARQCQVRLFSLESLLAKRGLQGLRFTEVGERARSETQC